MLGRELKEARYLTLLNTQYEDSLLFSICILFLFPMGNGIIAQDVDSVDQQFFKQSLNYVRYSLSLVNNSYDKALSSLVFNEIINNIDISKTKDQNVVSAYKQMLSLCSKLELSKQHKDFLDSQFQKKKETVMGKYTNQQFRRTFYGCYEP